MSIAENSSNKSFLGRSALLSTGQFTGLVVNCSVGTLGAQSASSFVQALFITPQIFHISSLSAMWLTCVIFSTLLSSRRNISYCPNSCLYLYTCSSRIVLKIAQVLYKFEYRVHTLNFLIEEKPEIGCLAWQISLQSLFYIFGSSKSNVSVEKDPKFIFLNTGVILYCYI